MNETVKNWLSDLYANEIEDVKSTIEDETIWPLGYNGEEPNPHTEIIRVQKEYIEVLEKKLAELTEIER